MTLGKMVMVAGLSLVAAAANAQFFLPPDLPSKLKIVDISDWKVKKVGDNILALVKVSFVNKSEYQLVFRESSFDLKITDVERKVKIIGEITPANNIVYPENKKSITIKEKTINIGSVSRPTEMEWGAFNEFVIEGTRYVLECGVKSGSEILRQAQEFELKAAKKDGAPEVQEHMFVINMGPAGDETKDRLLFDLFPLLTSSDKNWSAIINGKTKIGIRNGDATIFSPSPIDFEIQGKPAVKIDLDLDK